MAPELLCNWALRLRSARIKRGGTAHKVLASMKQTPIVAIGIVVLMMLGIS